MVNEYSRQVDELEGFVPGCVEEKQVFLTDNLMLVAYVRNGDIVKTLGMKVKTQQIEMDYVKVTFSSGTEQYYVLGDNVKWLSEGLRDELQ